MYYMLIYHLIYSFYVGSSVAASTPISLSNLNRGSVRASIQPFLHEVLRHVWQTQATKILPYNQQLRNICEIAVSKSYTKQCISFASTWDASTNAVRSICPAVLSIQSHPQCGAVHVRYAIEGITMISCRCIKAVKSPISSG